MTIAICPALYSDEENKNIKFYDRKAGFFY